MTTLAHLPLAEFLQRLAFVPRVVATWVILTA